MRTSLELPAELCVGEDPRRPQGRPLEGKGQEGRIFLERVQTSLGAEQ